MVKAAFEAAELIVKAGHSPLAELMSSMLLVIAGFEHRRRKNCQPDGRPLAVHSSPEVEYGSEILDSGRSPQALLAAAFAPHSENVDACGSVPNQSVFFETEKFFIRQA